MLNFSVTFLITIVNVTFLYLILRKILFKPVTKFMADRSEKIRRDIETARLATARAEALEAEFNEKLKGSRDEGQKIVLAYRERANEEHDRIISQAKAEAARIIAQAKAELDSERRDAERSLKRTTADLAILAASRVVRQNVDAEKNRALIDSFLEETTGAM